MVSQGKRIVIVGATSAIAEHCARLWVTDTEIELILVGRDLDKTERVAADLRVRNPRATLRVLVADFLEPSAISALVDAVVSAGPVDIVLIAHGALPEQASCQNDLRECRDALTVNAISPVLFAEAFIAPMQQAGHGTLAIMGSVAGDRGRRSNYVYGAAKGLVTRYAQGLQHRVAGSGVAVVLIKPGPTDTPMTAHLKAQGSRLAAVDDVAGQVVEGIARRAPVVYAPAKWRLIMLVIRHLPRFIFNRMSI
ncbi:MAG: SDR family NAD(P)-dependent oxidoreductase [Rhodocyclales bacterium]|nr:SDR family NAD(P)-dependent oxidoreductase [Rhodocyclales bacterium]